MPKGLTHVNVRALVVRVTGRKQERVVAPHELRIRAAAREVAIDLLLRL